MGASSFSEGGGKREEKRKKFRLMPVTCQENAIVLGLLQRWTCLIVSKHR